MHQEPPAPPPAAPPPAAPPASGGDAGEPKLPWEERQQLGFVEALIATGKLLFTAPGDGFSRLRADGDLVSPILFGVILSLIGQIFAQFWSLLTGAAWTSMLGMMEGMEGIGGIEGMALFGATSVGSALVTLILTPIFYVIFLFIFAGIFHLSLMLLGALEGSPLGFEGTLKANAYTSVAALANIVPLVGGLIGFVISIILLVIGFTKVHRIDQGKAILAVLIPIGVCCACAVLCFLVFGAAIFAAIAGAAGG